MKHLKVVVALVAIFLSFSLCVNAQNKKKVAEVTYSVNLHCENCQKKVEAALPYIKGVKDMKVNLNEQKIWLQYDPTKTSKTVLAAELKKLGYPAKEITAEVK